MSITCFKCGEFIRNCKCPKTVYDEAAAAHYAKVLNEAMTLSAFHRVLRAPRYHPAWGTLTTPRLRPQ